jgi:hypothetical protein
MATTEVVTFRIDAKLLAALKSKVRREGRTVSAALVELVRSDVQPTRSGAVRPRRTLGMFADFEAPELDDLLRFRRSSSRRLVAAPPTSRRW